MKNGSSQLRRALLSLQALWFALGGYRNLLIAEQDEYCVGIYHKGRISFYRNGNEVERGIEGAQIERFEEMMQLSGCTLEAISMAKELLWTSLPFHTAMYRFARYHLSRWGRRIQVWRTRSPTI